MMPTTAATTPSLRGVTTTGAIVMAPLIITATTNAKTYDSTEVEAIPTVSGLQGGDSFTGLVKHTPQLTPARA